MVRYRHWAALAVVLFACLACTPESETPIPQDEPGMVRGNVFLDSVELTPGNRPELRIAGNLPTPCHQPRWAFNRSRDVVLVTVYSAVHRDSICAQMLQPFAIPVPLRSDDLSRAIFVNETKVQ